ncbi:MAG TPA: nuclear transport factor 2 family protein [Solirubrobacterales bacterium]|nr:nuclear transport factor 2 family protein [Solirubrobacterales bacterium]
MANAEGDSAEAVEQLIERYNDAWNRHDVEAIVAMHAPGMVFENHTAGERVEGAAVRDHVASIFAAWPDLRFATRRLYVREGLAVCEWTATATHTQTMRRSGLEAEPSGARLEWEGVDVFPIENGQIVRKDVYADSLSILRGVGLVD